MSSPLQMTYPCVFGTSTGFEFQELQELPFKVRDLLVAITSSEVELAQNDACVKMLCIKSNGQQYTWIGQYRKAYEMGFSREGGYYGAGVWLPEISVNSRSTLDLLDTLSRQVNRLALDAGKFRTTIASILPELLEVPSVKTAMKALHASQRPRSRGGLNADAKRSAFIGQPLAFVDLVDWGQTDVLAQAFNSLIIAPTTTFPKVGASSNITQYSSLAELERTLDKDYSVRFAKLEAQDAKAESLAKDSQRKAQLLEAELNQRRSETEAFKKRIAQFELLAQRANQSFASEARLQSSEDSSWMDRTIHLGSPWFVAPFTAVVSVFSTLILLTYFMNFTTFPETTEAQLSPKTQGAPPPDTDEKTSGGQGELQKVPASPLPDTTIHGMNPDQDVKSNSTDTASTYIIGVAPIQSSPTPAVSEFDTTQMQQKGQQVSEGEELLSRRPSYVFDEDEKQILLYIGDPTAYPLSQLKDSLTDPLTVIQERLRKNEYIERSNGDWQLTPRGRAAFNDLAIR